MYQQLVLAVFVQVAPCSSIPVSDLQVVASAVEFGAAVYEVKPLLLAAMVQHEAAGKFTATSYVGKDHGLLQIRLKTARTVYPKLTRRDLDDPYTNVLVGAAYLNAQIQKCRTVSRALGAYSSGHCQVNSYSRKVMHTYFKLKKEYSND